VVDIAKKKGGALKEIKNEGNERKYDLPERRSVVQACGVNLALTHHLSYTQLSYES